MVAIGEGSDREEGREQQPESIAPGFGAVLRRHQSRAVHRRRENRCKRQPQQQDSDRSSEIDDHGRAQDQIHARTFWRVAQMASKSSAT